MSEHVKRIKHLEIWAVTGKKHRKTFLKFSERLEHFGEVKKALKCEHIVRLNRMLTIDARNELARFESHKKIK